MINPFGISDQLMLSSKKNSEKPFFNFETESSRTNNDSNSFFIPKLKMPNFDQIPNNFVIPLSSTRNHHAYSSEIIYKKNST